MKWLVAFSLLSVICADAQNPCEFSTKVSDSLGDYRATKNYLIYEKNFAGASSYTYFSLALTDGLPTLNVQFVDKSKDFVKAHCLDKNSRIYLQLDNGKIVTLIHIDKEDCGTGLRNDDFNHRVLTGFFLFTKDSFDELKKSPISLMRIKYSTETADYIIKERLVSEMDGFVYSPNRYFIDTLHCLDN